MFSKSIAVDGNENGRDTIQQFVKDKRQKLVYDPLMAQKKTKALQSVNDSLSNKSL